MTWKEKFAHLMGTIAELPRPQGPITAMTMLAYEEALAELTIEELERARQGAGRTCRFFPSPAELRDLAGCCAVSPEVCAGIALDAAYRAVSCHGEYVSVDFDDWATNATIRRLGGWVAFCALPDNPWTRREWAAEYIRIVTGGCVPSQCYPLVGLHEQENRLKGYHDEIRQPERIATGLPITERPRLPGAVPAGLPQLAHDRGRPEDVSQLLRDTADALRQALCDDRPVAVACDRREGRATA